MHRTDKKQRNRKFQISITAVDIINKLSEEVSVQIIQARTAPENYNDKKTSRIIEILAIPNEYGTISAYAPEVKQEIVFYLDCYFVSDVLLKDLYLSFWNDTLYNISCRGSDELEEAMQVKFGNPKEKSETKTIICKNGLGISFNKEEYTRHSYWYIVPNKIFALSGYRYFFDDKCKPDIHYYFDINNTIVAEKKRKLIYLNKAKNEKIETENLKSKLKDF